jgi:lambda family phage minor tail protein L
MPINTEKINLELHNLESTSIVELYELDLSSYNVGVFRFHPGTNGVQTNIIWQGNDYQALPIEIEGIETKADGTLPRPTLSIANINGAISKIINSYDDLIGLKVRRKRTYIKYLDAINFEGSENPYGIPDSDSHFMDEIFFVNQKTSETPEVIQFELTSSLELENVLLPARQVLSNYCSWRYRDLGCGYTGKPMATEKDIAFYSFSGFGLQLPDIYEGNQDLTWHQTGIYVSGSVVTMESFDKAQTLYFICNPTGESISGADPRLDKINWKSDQCSKSVYGCYLRFSGQENTIGLPFGGFLKS